MIVYFTKNNIDSKHYKGFFTGQMFQIQSMYYLLGIRKTHEVALALRNNFDFLKSTGY